MRRIVFLLISVLAAGFLITCDRSEMFDFATVGPPASAIYLFSAGPPRTGGMGGYPGADSACRQAYLSTYPWLKMTVVRAFLGTEIAPLRLIVPADYWTSPVIAIKSDTTSNMLSLTWNDLWNGSIPVPISAGTDTPGPWWSGSMGDGQTDPSATCSSWTDELAPAGMTGDALSMGSTWIYNTSSACNIPNYLLCVGW